MWVLLLAVAAASASVAEQVASLRAEPMLLAQINLGDVLRRKPPIPTLPGRTATPNRTAPQAASPASAEKCKALVDWMSMLPREYPKVNFRTTVMDVLYPKAMNLFRDEYFQPLLGKPFTQATEAELRAYDQSVFRSCGPNQLSQEDLTTLQQLKVIVERPFLLKMGSFSQQEVTAGIADRATLRKWEDDTLKDLANLPASAEGFDKLESYRTRGTTDLAKLWPSEQKTFLDAVDERRKAQALGAAESLVQSAKAMKPGFQGARAISTMRAGAGKYVALLDDAGKTKVNAGLDEAMSAALRDGLQQERAKLNGLPRGIDGALAYVAWRKEFDLQVSGVGGSTDLASLRGEAIAKRRELLNQGLAEFQPLAAQYPKPGPRGKADELMTKLFPNPEDGGLAERQQYQALLSARVAAVQQAESAKQAAASAALLKAEQEAQRKAQIEASRPPVVKTGKPPHPCDVLAAHPDDPSRVSDGVADEKMATANAIQQCSLAVRQSPATARFQFQLGRAYFAAKQYDKALPALLKAQEAKYAPSFFYLGEAYQRGLIKGEKPDPEFAKELYQMAAAEGFAPAILALGGTVGADGGQAAVKTEFDPKLFVHADWMKALLDGDLVKLNQIRIRALVYANGIQTYMALDPNEFDPSCAKRVDRSLSASLDQQLKGAPPNGLPRLPRDMNDLIRMAKAMQGPIAEVPDSDAIIQDGVDDANAIAANYGSCAGATVERMYTNLKRFVREKPGEKKAEIPHESRRPPEERGALKQY